MGNDFFGDLGETITKTAKEISEKADSFFETQKLQSKAASEKRMVEKLFGDMGNLVYRRFLEGKEQEEELSFLCDEVTQHKKMIARYEEEIARRNGKKICGGCGALISGEYAFCPQCGAPCPDPEPEVMEGEVVDEDGKPVEEAGGETEAADKTEGREPEENAEEGGQEKASEDKTENE